MPRASVNKNYFNFIGGKHSDGSALISPENTASILQNINLHASGKIDRRLGLDYEESFGLSTTTFTDEVLRNSAVSFHEWPVVAGDGRRNFYVIRVGEALYFYNQAGNAPSTQELGIVDISSFSIDTIKSIKTDIQMSSGKGFLFVTGELYEPFLVEYDTIAATFSATKIEIQIRDFIGLDDGLTNEERPTALDPLHEYNIKNQGWGYERKSFETNQVKEDISIFREDTGLFPSNSDIPFLAMTPDPNQNGELQFRSSVITAEYSGTTLSAKGRYILNAFDKNRLEASGVFGLPLEFLIIRPRSTAFYSGRVWYGGVKGDIFFSQILEDINKAGRCYQDQDPTAEDFNELLDTDGGVISIPEAGEIYRLVEVSGSLLVLANNGVWQISGGETNFTANSTVVSKISNIGCVNAKAVVKVENNILFWSDEGIFISASDQISGRLNIQSLSVNRIDRDFNGQIPARAKIVSQGAYDRVSKKVFWSYHDGLDNTENALEAKYNSMMVFDTSLNAFYDYRLEDNLQDGKSSFMAGLIKGSGRSEGSSSNFVTVNGDTVTVNGVEVVTTVTFESSSEVAPKVLTFAWDSVSSLYQITFSEFCSRSFHDWFTQDGIGANYTSIVETNPETLGEPSVDKQATYLTTFYDFKRDGFGQVLSNPRPDPTDGFRVSQAPVEVLIKKIGNFRVSQAPVEILVKDRKVLRLNSFYTESIFSIPGIHAISETIQDSEGNPILGCPIATHPECHIEDE